MTSFPTIGKKQTPLWWREMALELRLPACLLCGYAYYSTKLYYDAQSYYKPNGTWGVCKGTLLEIKRHTYRHHYLPRYSVRYSFELDGQTYTSRRSTSASVYRDWFLDFVPHQDQITEVQYLQSNPPLRVNSPCTVFYRKDDPSLSCIAHDPNSIENSLIAFAGIFTVLWATKFKHSYIMWKKKRFESTFKVGFPEWAEAQKNPLKK